MLLENGRGLVGASTKRSFTYRPTPGGGSAPPPGPHVITGTSLADRLFGTIGTDVIRGLAGRDELHGGRGRDTLYGGKGDDRLYGGDGGDTLVGGLGSDRVYGGRGADVIQLRDGRADEAWCGRGDDHVKADPSDRVHGCEHVSRG
jgi:hypothetical protein